MVATGAREKSLLFRATRCRRLRRGRVPDPGQRDWSAPRTPLHRGRGNVGLIAGYHALQAGIGVVRPLRGAADCGGYKVHKDKLGAHGRAHSHLAHGDERERPRRSSRSRSRPSTNPGGRFRGRRRPSPADTIWSRWAGPGGRVPAQGASSGCRCMPGGREEIRPRLGRDVTGRIADSRSRRALGATWARCRRVAPDAGGAEIASGATVTEDVRSRGGVFPLLPLCSGDPLQPCISICRAIRS